MKPTVVLDGPNVAFEGGSKLNLVERWGCPPGAALPLIRPCIHAVAAAGSFWFERGHAVVVCFPPSWAPGRASDMHATSGEGTGGQRLLPCEQALLAELAGQGLFVFSPPGDAGVDDKVSIDTAVRLGGVLVSNDRYRDHHRQWSDEVAAADHAAAMDGDADMTAASRLVVAPMAAAARAKLDWMASSLVRYTFHCQPRPGVSQHAIAALLQSGACLGASELVDLDFLPHPDDAARVASMVVALPLPAGGAGVSPQELHIALTRDAASWTGYEPPAHASHTVGAEGSAKVSFDSSSVLADDAMRPLPPAADLPWPMAAPATPSPLPLLSQPPPTQAGSRRCESGALHPPGPAGLRSLLPPGAVVVLPESGDALPSIATANPR